MVSIHMTGTIDVVTRFEAYIAFGIRLVRQNYASRFDRRIRGRHDPIVGPAANGIVQTLVETC